MQVRLLLLFLLIEFDSSQKNIIKIVSCRAPQSSFWDHWNLRTDKIELWRREQRSYRCRFDNLCEAQALFNHWLARPLNFDQDEIAAQNKVVDFATRSHHWSAARLFNAVLVATIVCRLLNE